LQLGGSDPAQLAQATQIAADYGYDEVNLNCGCPSDRVQSGSFGAVLMERPEVVAACVRAMGDVTDLPITVKCRIGVDDQVPGQVLPDFLAQVSAAGVDRFTIHARKAWLQGLSPKENRDVPPLDYELVHEMKGLFPHLHLSVNGGCPHFWPTCQPHSRRDRASDDPLYRSTPVQWGAFAAGDAPYAWPVSRTAGRAHVA